MYSIIYGEAIFVNVIYWILFVLQQFLAIDTDCSRIHWNAYTVIHVASLLAWFIHHTDGCYSIWYYNQSVRIKNSFLLHLFKKELYWNDVKIKRFVYTIYSTHNTVFKTLTEAVRESEIRKHDPSLVLKESRSS